MSTSMLLLAVLDGLSYGALVFLVAVGLSLVFGVLQIVNIAHGSFFAIGAYAAVSFGLLLTKTSLPPWLVYATLTVAALVVGLVVGGVVEAVFLRRIYKKEEVLQLLVTFAIFMVLEDSQKLVWGVQPYFFTKPMDLLGTVEMAGVAYSTYQLVVLPAVALAVLLGMRYLLRYTFTGRVVRAVSEDRETSMAMGIASSRVFFMTFVAGASLAAFGGALASGSTSIVPGMGGSMTILSFAVAATAGLGQIEGAAIAALLIGLGRSLAIQLWPELDVVVPYVIMFLVLSLKPAGLFTVAKTRRV